MTSRPPGASPPSPELARALADPSRRVGRYVILDELGRGGMGVVYRGFDPSLRRGVAVKLILDPARAGERGLARFQREATAAARLRHPGIVAVHEVGVHAGRPFLVLDLVDGESLEALVARERLAPKRVAALIRDVARALHHAHEHGVLHRDVKPENILVDRSGRPLLGDFGLARDLGDGDRLTGSAEMIGTPAFMAPEQLGAAIAQGPPTDVYAVGGTIYRALTGRPPFQADSAFALIRAVLADEPPPLRTLAPAVHPDLETIALRCLEKEPARRYPTAAALADDLDRFLGGEPIAARPTSRARRALRRHRGLVAVGSLGLAIAIFVGTLAWALAVRSARAARREVVDAARLQARAARDAFVGDDGASTGDAGGRPFALGLAALETSGRFATLAPEDDEARGVRFEVATALGDLARDRDQESVAAFAYARAVATGLDDGRAAAALAEVDAARAGRDEAGRRSVERVLEAARAGELDGAAGERRAVLTLTALADPSTVALLGAELDAVSASLQEAFAAALRSAAAPRPSGEAEPPPVDAAALDAELAALAASPATTSFEDGGAIEASIVRLEASAAASSTAGVAPSRNFVLGRAQSAAVDDGALRVARLCCRALGRIGIRDAATGPLVRYLVAERDPGRASSAAVALCYLGGERAEEVVLAAWRGRFPGEGPFWDRTRPFLSRTGVEPGSGPLATALDYERRSALRAAKGDLEGAIEDLTCASELAPTDARPLYLRGLIRAEDRDHLGAIEDLTRAIELDDAQAYAWHVRGATRQDIGRLDAALADFDRAIELDPRLHLAWHNRGAIRMDRGDLRGALADLRHAAALQPDNAHITATLARALDLSGEPDAALRTIDRAVELDPHLAYVWIVRHMILVDRRRLGEAVAAAARAIEIAPDDSVGWNARGVARRDGGDLRGALADFTRATELDAEHPVMWCNLGGVRLLLRDLDGALEAFDRSLEIDPRSVRALVLRGQAHRDRGSFREALADLDRAVALRPGAGRPLESRGRVRAAMGDPAGAIDDFDRALALEPDRPTTHYNRGQARATLGREDEALEDFRRAVELDAEFALAWNGVGSVLRGRRELDGARAAFDRAIELDPRLGTGFHNRALVREEQGDRAGAFADLDRAIELDPGSPLAFLLRGTMRYEDGDRARAAPDLERFIELAPNDARVALARVLLRELGAGGGR